MKLSVLNIFLIVAVLTSFNVFSQEHKNAVKIDSIVPNSIYSFQTTSLHFNSKFSLNNRLNLTQYNFVYLNRRNIEDGYFTLPFAHSGGKPSSLIFETYNDIYHTMNLKSSFFKVSQLYDVPPRVKK